MKKVIIAIAMGMFLLVPLNALAIPDPAAVYCQDMGGQLDTNGNCAFSDVTCPEWEFYRGQCGNNYSICAKNGYQTSSKTITTDGATYQFAVCTDNAGRECISSDLENNLCGSENSLSAGYKLNYKNFGNTNNQVNNLVKTGTNNIWYFALGAIVLVILLTYIYIRRKK